MNIKKNSAQMEIVPDEIKDVSDEVNATCKGADSNLGAPRLLKINRRQLVLRSIDVENLVGAEHEVRAIWELVGRLDLERFYDSIESKDGVAGRAAYDPRLLISIWIYSYSKGIGSAREISRLCEYDPAYQWLTGMDRINYHTLSDFRTDHKGGLDEIFVEVLGILSNEGMVTLERVMHDGTRVKANASGDTFRREERVKEHLQMAREQVNYVDGTVDEEISVRIKRARERVVRERVAKLELAMVELKKIQDRKTNEKERVATRVSITDPEARIMKQPDGGYAPSYNVQISTDEEEKVIVGVGVSQSRSDYEELEGAEQRIEENMGVTPQKMVVDGGFISRKNIIAMSDKVDLVGPIEDNTSKSIGQLDRRGVEPAFRPESFKYDSENNIYICPSEKILKYSGKEVRIGRINHRYQAAVSDCRACIFREKCCPANPSKGRSIVRGEDDPIVTAFIEKMGSPLYKGIYKRRGEVAEFPNAWLKSKIGLRQFRLRGLIKVGIEALWACLTYNIQQWIRLCWKPQIALV